MKKKYLYQVLTSVSLLTAGASFSPPMLLSVSAQQVADGFTAEKGTFTVGESVINVRSQPSTSAAIVSSYKPGDQVNYDMKGSTNGFRWISYQSNLGERHYVAIGQDGGSDFGTLSVTTVASDSQASETSLATNQSSGIDVTQLLAGNFSSVAGEWALERYDEKLVIDAEGYVGMVKTPDNKLGNIRQSSEVISGDGSILAFRGGKTVDNAGINDFFFFYPAGVPLDRGISSDETRDRLVIGHKESSYENPYYFVAPQKAEISSETSTSSTEASSDNETATNSSNVSPSKEVDVNNIQAGDFSAVAGTWESGKGNKLVLTSDGTVDAVLTINGEEQEATYQVASSEMLPTGEIRVLLSFNGTPVPLAFGILPKGVKESTFNLESDDSKVRLFRYAGGANPDAYTSDDVYYQVVPVDEEITTETSSSTSSPAGHESSSSSTSKTKTSSSSSTKTETDSSSTSSSPANGEGNSSASTSSSISKTKTSASSSTKTEMSVPSTTASSAVQTTTPTTKATNPIQSVYQKVTGRKDLPSTGESVSVLGLVGLGILGLVTIIKKRRY